MVLDPFAGSGSTLVAAIEEGLDFLGIEERESYVRIAEHRITTSKKEMKVVDLTIDEPQDEDPFSMMLELDAADPSEQISDKISIAPRTEEAPAREHRSRRTTET